MPSSVCHGCGEKVGVGNESPTNWSAGVKFGGRIRRNQTRGFAVGNIEVEKKINYRGRSRENSKAEPEAGVESKS